MENLEELTQQMTQIYKIMGSDDFAESVADMLWNIYTKAQDKGFTKEQAMQIVLHFAQSKN